MQLKYILQQMLLGLQYMHKNSMMHRDIKGGNILISEEGIVKIADFGLARDMAPYSNYTTKVVTRWFRAPEIALGSKTYTQNLDVWSIGCTFAEIISKQPLFPSRSDQEHFQVILR
jgi:serine/threonine protein kinase